MKSLTVWWKFVAVIVLAGLFLVNRQANTAAIQWGLTLCAGSVLPALFPFFVVTELWITLGYAEKIGRLTSPVVRKLFHLPEGSATALFLGSLGGYPVGVKTAAKLFESRQLNQSEAEATLIFCNNAGPAFVLGIAGNKLFGNPILGFLLWGIHLASAGLIGILFRPQDIPPKKAISREALTMPSFLPSLTEAIYNGGQTALLVCINVLFFSLLVGTVSSYFGISPVTAVLLGSLELTSGFQLLSELPVSLETIFVLSAALLGWGSICVHCQSLSILYRTGLSAKPYLLGKLLHAAVSLTLACLVAPVCCQGTPQISSVSHFCVPVISLLLAWGILLFLKTSYGIPRKHGV